MKKELETVMSSSKKNREHLRKTNQLKSWRDWAFDRANKGDETALEVLRQKIGPLEDFGLGMVLGKDSKHVLLNGLPRKVRRDGMVEYGIGKEIFLDRGDAIIFKSLGSEIVKRGLLAAQVKFGKDFHLKGPDSFLKAAYQDVELSEQRRSIKVNKDIDR
jgi:predicted NBD/HSP70 family sugar kinase